MKIQVTIPVLLFILIAFSAVTRAQSSFLGLGDLPGGTIWSAARNVSSDGSVIVGKSESASGGQGFCWTALTGMVGIGDLPGGSFFSLSSGTSEDGSVIVGFSNSVNGGEAFRWTEVTGMMGLGDLPGGIFSSWAMGVSSDGSVVTGSGENQEGKSEAYRWTISNGMVGLGNIPGGDSSYVWASSNNGNVIVGYDRIHPTPQTSIQIAFRWTPAGGMQPLNPPSGFNASYALGISGDGTVTIGYLMGDSGSRAARWTISNGWELIDSLRNGVIPLDATGDGSVIIGHGPDGSFIWDQNNGIRNLKTVFEQDYGLNLAGWNLGFVYAISDDGTVIIGTGTNPDGQLEAWRAVLPQFAMVNPLEGERWIAGENDTIKWSGGNAGQFLNIEFSTDNGNTYSLISIGVPADSGYYIWSIPQNILSTKVKIKISDFTDSTTFIRSEIFKIKPYVLTRLNEDSTYYEYRKNRDQWGFSNNQADMWPPEWYNQFDYTGTDPFTGSQYSQWQGNFIFASSNAAEHLDWISFVNTFGIDACYRSTTLGIYSSTALAKWDSKKDFWAGSCFGIAGVNALAFGYKNQFVNKFPDFPNFVNPITVISGNSVKKIVNEIFSHQYGNPSKANDNVSFDIKTPNQTINELKQMLREDSSKARSISIYNNSGTGGHSILPYALKQDTIQNNLYYILVYDNSNPDSINPITVNTLSNGGNGAWSTPDWPGWGGNFNMYLELTADTYLNTATLSKNNELKSPFIIGDDILEVNYKSESSIKILDIQGKVTGFINNIIFSEIPGSVPRIIKNGSETPPYGYSLPTNNYSVVLTEFAEDTVNTFFFTGNKSFVYERSGAIQTQTDRLFFDGGVSVANPDAQAKTVKLLNIINETTQEKLFVVRSVELAQNDSVKIENPDSNKFKVISYGSSKDYDLELNYITENGVGRFGDFNIPLDENTSHTFVPDWTDITNTELIVLVDLGNNGTIDDTLSLQNQVTGIGDDQGSLLSPNSYNLAQNYPNPFNPITKIRYSIPSNVKGQLLNVILKVYDVLGNEVAILINEEKTAGVYEVTFDASNLASGMYLYRLQAGSFVETKKMILMK